MEWSINEFHWLRPLWLWGILPTLIAFYLLWKNRHQQNSWHALIDPELIEHLLYNQANRKSNAHSAAPILYALLATCFALLALAGPSWEKMPEAPLKKNDTLVVIADLTLSMYTEDIAPSRLVRMRYKLLELLKQRKEGQTALIAYSGDAHVVSPLTDDAATIAALVPSLSPEIMPGIGSNASAAFELANQLVENTPANTRIVWFTDEVLAREQDNIVQAVARYGSELIIIGVGTEDGGPIPLPSGKFLKNQHEQIAHARLDRQQLSRLALSAGGNYLDIRANNSDIQFILQDKIISRLNKDANDLSLSDDTRPNDLQFDAWRDRGAWLCLLLIPFALGSFRRGWILVAIIVILPLQTPQVSANEAVEEQPPAFGWRDLWQTRDQQAQALLDKQDYQQAWQYFSRPDWKGVAAYKNGQYQQALDAFAASLDQSDGSDENLGKPQKKRRAHEHYNHGHALARNQQLQQALEAYQQALNLDPEFEDAAKARSIVESLLDQQQQQAQQNQQQSGDQSSDQSGNSSRQDGEHSNPSDAADNEQSDSQQPRSESTANTEQQPSGTQQSGQPGSPQQAQPQELAETGEKSESPDNTQQQVEASQSVQTSTLDEKAEQQATNKLAKNNLQNLDSEQQAKLEQWLNKIQDDPGGLLRRKFQYERQLREREGNVVDQSEDGQLW